MYYVCVCIQPIISQIILDLCVNYKSRNHENNKNRSLHGYQLQQQAQTELGKGQREWEVDENSLFIIEKCWM
jgi:hypothetical protein